jgi:hypothetical protein
LGEGQKHSTKELQKMGSISSEGEKIPYGKIEQKTIEGDSMLTQVAPTPLGECLSYNNSKISPFVR